VIAMTAHAMVEERERCLRVGMNDHVAKPIDPDLMFATIARWIRVDGRGAAPALRGHDAVPLLEVDGLDAAAGLRRAGSNSRLYRNLLRQFAERHADAGERMRSAATVRDHATVERIAHTVRGVAGNMGFGALAAAAAEAERAFRTGVNTHQSLEGFEVELARAMAALGRALPAAEAHEAAPDAQATAQLSTLAQMLVDSDGNAIDYLADHRGGLRSVFSSDDFAAFERSVNSYEFEAALALLRSAAAVRGVPLTQPGAEETLQRRS
jgi:two-component system, sensor histidine kinase and response regulator